NLLAGPLWAASSCVVAECHGAFGEAKYVHAPVAENDCASCHEATSVAHPGAGSMQLVEPEPQLCLQCHENPAADMAFPHSALKQGCTGCHSPHQGKLPALVLQSGGKLCLTCHGQVMDGKLVKMQSQYGFADGIMDPFGKLGKAKVQGQTLYGLSDGMMDLFGNVDETGIVGDLHDVEDCTPEAKYVHGPVSAGSCYMCHGTHGSDNQAMLILPGNGTCVACHFGIKKINDNAVSQHDPVANGNCWDCHAPHVSNYKPYLKAFYPKGFYVPYEDENFALCFNCHSKDAFLFARTSEATAFRNRDQNLHFFHVNRSEKGRVCKSCHGVHGGDQEKLLMSRIPDFGKWDLPLTWASDGERATCYVGCHRPKTYDRQLRIKNL
ncbi:MAG: hypothetical protein KAU27_12140, partial [Desulfuromonadales bacterium]|nr:hypothetical protein [Desulfuromonadales bacterium]